MISIKLTLVLLATIVSLSNGQTVRYEWNYLNFTWPSVENYEEAVNSRSYVPVNNVITGIKVWKDKVYLTLPRWKSGVPATLAVTDVNGAAETSSPLLEPYPSWEMQQLDDCKAFQYVQSMEIDPEGRMWILENGRTEFKTSNPRTKCLPRLVILDIEKNGEVLLDYTFPEGDVVHINDVFLNDLVLDHEDGGWAYITDHSDEHPGIIVFSLKEKNSWKVTHDSMLPKEEASKFLVDGYVSEIRETIDGIALSAASTEGDRTLYYTGITSFEMFSVPVSALKNRQPINDKVKLVGRKSSQTDGMAVSSSGLLYFGLLSEHKVSQWDTKGTESFTNGQEVIADDKVTNHWPDTFAIDENEQLWWTTNKLTKFFADEIDVNEKNYRVISLKTKSRSYQYYEDGSYPQLPTIVDS